MSIDKKNMQFFVLIEQGEGRIVNSHRHEGSMEILEVLDGDVEIQIGTARFEGAEGDFYYVPPGLVHRVEAKGSARVRSLIFKRSIIEANLESIDSEILFMFEVQSKNKIMRFSKDHPIYYVLKMYMDESYDEFVAKDVCYKLPVRANIYLMVTALLRHYCAIRTEADRNIYHNVLRLRPAIAYIEDNFIGKIYIEELSEKIMVSPDYFTKMFKDSIGKTPIDYINDLRVNRALALLCEEEKSIQEISDEVGFCNPNYFHKIFKQYIGLSPLAYRKSTR